MERLVLGQLFGDPALDGVGEDVGDRLHEADVLAGELADSSRADAENAVRLALALDQDDHRAPHARLTWSSDSSKRVSVRQSRTTVASPVASA